MSVGIRQRRILTVCYVFSCEDVDYPRRSAPIPMIFSGRLAIE